MPVLLPDRKMSEEGEKKPPVKAVLKGMTPTSPGRTTDKQERVVFFGVTHSWFSHVSECVKMNSL